MPITDWSVLRPNLGPVRVASGPESAKATDKLRIECEKRDAWPFPWVYPPPNSERRNPMGNILAPAVGATATILAFTVDQGYQFELMGLILGVFTTGMLAIGNPGDFTFSVTRNLPTSGTVPLQGSPLADLQNIPFPLGNPLFMPFPLPRSENFGPTDVIRANVTNVSGTGGAPNFALAMFCGWLRKT
jgi:hypothetical protein